MILEEQKNMVIIPPEFGVGAFHPFPYPEDNMRIFEEWYFDTLQEKDARDRTYLPIFWTGYYVRHKYGKDFKALDWLQQYINKLDKTRKYYTIVQYDDGILNDLSEFDIKVFSMSGKPMDYPLPLICRPHKYEFLVEKDIWVSFVGRMTHPVRSAILKQIPPGPRCYITDKHHSLEDYCRILARSVFVLCPRGYGPTSFRIMEALQYGAIPLAITDNIFFGHNFHFPGSSMPCASVLHTEDAIQQALAIMSQHIPRWNTEIADCFEKYYTFEGSKKLMLQELFVESLNLNKICDPSA